LNPYRADAEVREIVRLSSLRNSLDEISGALVFNGLHFAQYVEGAPSAIESLMRRIGDDRRHSHIDTVFDEEVDVRHFTSWDMVYAGPSSLVGGMVLELAERLYDDPEPVRVSSARLVVHSMRELPLAA
jgi:hypothetical protein